jgi:hypothetical protein
LAALVLLQPQLDENYRAIAAATWAPGAAAVFDLLASLPPDFMADGRNETPAQERESF